MIWFKRVSRRTFAILALGLILGGTAAYFSSRGYLETHRIDELRFSNTQEWDPSVYAQKIMRDPIVGEAALSIELPPPPPNSSEETAGEISFLRALEAERTEDQVFIIEREIFVDFQRFGGVPYADIIKDRPHTRALLRRTHAELSGLIVVQKEHFDRVRPHKLDPELMPVIAVPGHPAYPSGHATQSMFTALVLSALNPSGEEIYKENARSIAHNREIAGVHYPSDARAGQALAEAYFTLLQDSEEYQRLLNEAKEEW